VLTNRQWGCINQVYAVTGDTWHPTCQVNQASQFKCLSAEAQWTKEMLEWILSVFQAPMWAQQLGLAYLVLSGFNWAVGDPIWGGDGALSGSNALSQSSATKVGWKQNNTGWFHAPNHQYLDSRLGNLYPTPAEGCTKNEAIPGNTSR